MLLTPNHPLAAYYDVYFWKNGWRKIDNCLEAEDGQTGYIRIEVMQANKTSRIVKMIGSVRFIRREKVCWTNTPNPPGWGKKQFSLEESS